MSEQSMSNLDRLMAQCGAGEQAPSGTFEGDVCSSCGSQAYYDKKMIYLQFCNQVTWAASRARQMAGHFPSSYAPPGLRP